MLELATGTLVLVVIVEVAYVLGMIFKPSGPGHPVENAWICLTMIVLAVAGLVIAWSIGSIILKP